jgi:soluble lytic murein transglycosylase-like protein
MIRFAGILVLLVGFWVPKVSQAVIAGCSDLGSTYTSAPCLNNFCGGSICICKTGINAQEDGGEICCADAASNNEQTCFDKQTGTPGREAPTDGPVVGQTQEKNPISFRVTVSLPGSKFLAGQSIAITGETLGEYIAALYFFLVSAAGILAAGMIFYSGIRWLTAGGNRGAVQDAKDHILSSLIGLGLAFGAYLILVTISPKLVKFNSLNVRQVVGQQQTFAEQEVAVDGYKSEQPLGTVSASQSWYTKVYNQYNNFIAPVATNGLDPKLMYAIMLIESSGFERATSKASPPACGLFQLRVSTAQPYLPEKPNLTCADLYDPALNAKASAGYLKTLFSSTCPMRAREKQKDGSYITKQCDQSLTNCKNGDLRYVVAAYNGGAGANCNSASKCPPQRDVSGNIIPDSKKTWWECEKNSGYAQTRNYVQQVLSAYEQIKTFTNP